MPTVKFLTLGCKVNQYDTQSIRECFLKKGFKEIRGKHREAGTYLINTCTITSIADQKSRSVIKRCINENPEARVIVTGCMAKSDYPKLSGIKGVGLVIEKTFFSEGITDFCHHTRAFLKIQDGCDHFCAYCKVPLVRGRSRSRQLQEVVNEAKDLAVKGFKEIVITGVCLGAYGRDLRPQKDLIEVIDALERIEGILRIRLSSIEAGDITDALIEKIVKSEKLCRHLHIPIQSGDDKILQKMRRKYKRGTYVKLIRKLNQRIPGLAVTTDCIVGFPGETEASFKNTLNLVKIIKPLKVHIFPYSKREGTGAALEFSSGVPAYIIKNRIGILREAAESCARDYQNKFLGQKMQVLFEAESKDMKGYWEGYSGNYVKVLLKSRYPLKNKLITVSLISIYKDCAIAVK